MKSILLRKNKKYKKAVTELLAYALLIGLAITLSILVYNWLKFYVMPYETKTCPDGVSLILQEYSCNGGKINITVKNKGLFKIDGYLIKVNNETDNLGKPKGLPVHLLDSISFTLNPSDSYLRTWDYGAAYGRIVEIEIEPIRIQENKTIYCDKAVIKQTIRSLDCL